MAVYHVRSQGFLEGLFRPYFLYLQVLSAIKHKIILNLFIPRVSDMDSSIFEFEHIHCCKQGLSKKSIIDWQTVYIPMRRLITSRLICIYTVCKGFCVGLQDESIQSL